MTSPDGNSIEKGWLQHVFERSWQSLVWLSNSLGWLSGGLTLIMMAIVTRDVVGRYFFGAPCDWSLELSCYLVVALGYLGAAYTEVEEKHIRIDFLYTKFHGKTKTILNILISIVGLIWSATLLWQGSLLAFHSLRTGARSETIMMWPLFPSQIMVSVGTLLLCLILLCRIVQNICLLVRKES